MGVERVTPWPEIYANEPKAWDVPALEAEESRLWNARAKDKFYLLLPITIRQRPFETGLSTAKRRQIAQIIACAVKEKAVFDKQNNCYRIGGWSVGDWATVTPLFSVEGRQSILSVLDALAQAGCEVDESECMELHWAPPTRDIDSALALSDLAERENEFLKQLLQLRADMRFIADKDTFAFDIALDDFSSEAMNRVLLVVWRMILHALDTRQGAEKRHLETSA